MNEPVTIERNGAKVMVNNCDCIEFMRGFPDKSFDLAIVDPPYGIGASAMQMGKGINKAWKNGKSWDRNAPTPEYFTELNRVSERQIIWGGNYFSLPVTGGWIFWDKDRRKDISFSDGELAWTSFLKVLKKATIRYDGFIGADTGKRIHPTQKPVALYSWLLGKYANPGRSILDTHMGSGSIAIACLNLGFNLIACELDSDYFNAAVERIRKENEQLVLA